MNSNSTHIRNKIKRIIVNSNSIECFYFLKSPKGRNGGKAVIWHPERYGRTRCQRHCLLEHSCIRQSPQSIVRRRALLVLSDKALSFLSYFQPTLLLQSSLSSKISPKAKKKNHTQKMAHTCVSTTSASSLRFNSLIFSANPSSVSDSQRLSLHLSSCRSRYSLGPYSSLNFMFV